MKPVLDQVNGILLGKDEAVRLALSCLMAGGHLLIEDIPGVGKTTLAQALARALGLSYRRIQFTSDLLPADVIGISVYRREQGDFEFHPGPVFSQLVLADEINRATPRAQSALLEVMEEHQVTVDGVSHPLPEPFFVIATQNPTEQVGTYPLPESQLDRFLMRISLGYPAPSAERSVLRGRDRRELLREMHAAIEPAELAAVLAKVPNQHASDALLDYLQALVRATRDPARFRYGLSTRAGLALLRAAQAWSLLSGRNGVLPEDLQAVFVAVAGHRLLPADHADRRSGAQLAAAVLDSVAIP
jgi:MoxR-like ATPase